MAERTRDIKAGPLLGDVSKVRTQETKAWLGIHLEKYPRKQKWVWEFETEKKGHQYKDVWWRPPKIVLPNSP